MLPKKVLVILKTLPRIAKELGVAVSTLRYRISPYEDFMICSTTNKGKGYSSEIEGIISEINTYIGQGKQREEIIDILSMKCPREIQPIQEKTNNEASNLLTFIINIPNIDKYIGTLMFQQAKQISNNADATKLLTAIINIFGIEKYIGILLYNQARQLVK